MKLTKRATDVAQLLTGIAVVAGLMMVFYELRQAKTLALADLLSEAYSETLEDWRAVMGEYPAVALAKACHRPESLTREDMVILDAYYENALTQVSRLRVLENVGHFESHWELAAGSFMSPILRSEYGRWWFEHKITDDSQLQDIAKNALPRIEDCRNEFAALSAADG